MPGGTCIWCWNVTAFISKIFSPNFDKARLKFPKNQSQYLKKNKIPILKKILINE